LERITPPSATAAQVSSHEVSIPRINTDGRVRDRYASTAVGDSSHMIRASSPLSW
jgi:hypothetical protein